MKDYQKKYNIGNPATVPLPILPALESALDPKVGELSMLVYDNKGTYLGWCNFETMKKFLYGKLYYKTSGRYSINTIKNHRYSATSSKTTCIKEKATGAVALVVVAKTLEDKDLVDVSNNKEKAVYALKHEIVPFTFNEYNYTQIPDKFGFIKPLQTEIIKTILKYNQEEAKAKHVFFAGLKKKLVDHLQSVIDSEDKLKAGSEEAGINLDF